jgi:lariat debranching enzyme
MSSMINVAIEGCCHGELDTIYDTLLQASVSRNVHVDLLLVCGDFEGVRDELDLSCVAVPAKYRKLVCIIQ